MCELFAMSAREPATVNISLEEFAAHGGLRGPHRDGWGIAYYDGRAAHLLREPEPASYSDWIPFVERHHLRGRIVISHIRRASRGGIGLANTHPFSRELGGRLHVFAHNGMLEGIDAAYGDALGHFRPIGDTDSELAFCVLLARLTPLWLAARPPSSAARNTVVSEFARDLRALGAANFLYSDGELLFAHADRRKQSDGAVRAPGLYRLARSCTTHPHGFDAPGIKVASDATTQQVTLFASVPLTPENWVPLAGGEVVAVQAGAVI